MNLEISAEFVNDLKVLARKKTLIEKDCNAFDAGGGNYDDTYAAGCDDGEIYLAREVLTELEMEWEENESSN